MNEILLKGGQIYDGTGRKPYTADLLIRGDRIAKIGRDLAVSGSAVSFNLDGLSVTPGFIDIHRHCDKEPLLPKNENRPGYGSVLLRQGITSVVTGNCGISMYPLNPDSSAADQMRSYYAPVLGDIAPFKKIVNYEAYLKDLGKVSLPVNTGSMIGMGAVRIAVKGFSDAPFTLREIRQCQEIISTALSQGALGVSIGLMYLPECWETPEELGEILKPLGRQGRILTTHIRGEGDSLVKSIEEVLKIAEIAGCRLEISHFKSCGIRNWGTTLRKAIRLIEDARSAGQDVSCDFYPYNCGSTTLMSLVPPQFVNGDIRQALQKLQTETGLREFRSLLGQTFPDWDNYTVSLGLDRVVLSAVSCEKNRPLLGQNITQIARTRCQGDEAAALAELLVSENGAAAAIIQSMDAADVDTVAVLPYSLLISDAIYADTDCPHPRMFGAFPHFLHDFSVKRKLLPLSKAIAKMTKMPALRMGIQERGEIKEGYFSDLNVFDPDHFCDHADYTAPLEPASGLDYCFVNGKLTVRNDCVLSEENGLLLKA